MTFFTRGNRGGRARRSGQPKPPTTPRPERVAGPAPVDHSRRTGAADPLRPSQPRRRSPHVQPRRGTVLLLHRPGRHRKYPSGHRPARRRNRWRLCSPNGASTNRTVRDSSGSCPRCSPTTCRHPGEPPPMSNLLRPCVFRWRRCRLSERETEHVIAFCRANRLSLNAVISAVILLAEWQLRGTPNIPVPYIYPVDLRYFLSPPVSATGCTNPVGVATYLAEIDHRTRCRRPRPRYRRDVSGRPVRRRDPAVSASLQPAIRRESTGLARCRHAYRQRTGPSRAHTSRSWN